MSFILVKGSRVEWYVWHTKFTLKILLLLTWLNHILRLLVIISATTGAFVGFSMQICMSTIAFLNIIDALVLNNTKFQSFFKYALFFDRDSNDITLFSIFKIGISWSYDSLVTLYRNSRFVCKPFAFHL